MVNLAQTAERGLFDMLFWADSAGLWAGDKSELSRICRTAWIEPFTMLAGLSMVTNHIGLTFTMTSTYTEPFNVARHFMSLDVMSGGRAAWNLVTSANQAEA